MALDFTIPGSDGAPLRVVGVRLDEHERLVEYAEVHGFPFFLRTRDYFGDASFEATEIEQLRFEVCALRDVVRGDRASPCFLARLVELLDEATARGCGILVLAD